MWEQILNFLLQALQADAVVAFIALTLAPWVAGKVFAKWPKARKFYDQYKGEMVRIVKLVETEIPDDTDNQHLKRADLALQYIIRLIEKRENRTLTEAEKSELSNDLNEVHYEVESAGGLRKAQ